MPIIRSKTTPKKSILAFILLESLQEIVKRQDGSMSHGIVTISSIEPSWLKRGRRYTEPRTSPTHPLSGYTGRVSPRTATGLFFMFWILLQMEEMFGLCGQTFLPFA